MGNRHYSVYQLIWRKKGWIGAITLLVGGDIFFVIRSSRGKYDTDNKHTLNNDRGKIGEGCCFKISSVQGHHSSDTEKGRKHGREGKGWRYDSCVI